MAAISRADAVGRGPNGRPRPRQGGERDVRRVSRHVGAPRRPHPEWHESIVRDHVQDAVYAKPERASIGDATVWVVTVPRQPDRTSPFAAVDG